MSLVWAARENTQKARVETMGRIFRVRITRGSLLVDEKDAIKSSFYWQEFFLSFYSLFFPSTVWPRATRNPTKWMPLLGDIMNRFLERANSMAWFQPPPRNTLNLLLAGPTGLVRGPAG